MLLKAAGLNFTKITTITEPCLLKNLKMKIVRQVTDLKKHSVLRSCI